MQPQPSDLFTILAFLTLKSAYYKSHFTRTQHERDMFLAHEYSLAAQRLTLYQERFPDFSLSRPDIADSFFAPLPSATPDEEQITKIIAQEIRARRDINPQVIGPLQAFMEQEGVANA